MACARYEIGIVNRQYRCDRQDTPGMGSSRCDLRNPFRGRSVHPGAVISESERIRNSDSDAGRNLTNARSQRESATRYAAALEVGGTDGFSGCTGSSCECGDTIRTYAKAHIPNANPINAQRIAKRPRRAAMIAVKGASAASTISEVANRSSGALCDRIKAKPEAIATMRAIISIGLPLAAPYI